MRTLRPVCERRSIVLGYHGVAESRLRDDLSLLQVSPARFRKQIEALLSAGFSFLTMAELARRAGGGTPEPGLAAITFDDGMRNNHAIALPILREYDIPATVYVTIDFIGGVSPWIGAQGDGAMMREPELHALVAAGWELGAHTMTHPDLSRLDYETCRREIEQSRDELQRIAGVDVETFAYPFGRYNPEALAAARDSGLLAAVTTGSGSWAPYEITRAMISTIDPLPIVLLKLTDRYEPLLGSPPLRFVRRASKRARASLSGRERGDRRR
ncbi:MAG TPA: polysaccharide deacetylase family protein [Solirubrobacteraceae bacterium]|nr:polysaccharide deacetylase family protein [Solirubrobacteraceae bacterium]